LESPLKFLYASVDISDIFDEYGLLSCKAMYFGESPTFRRNIALRLSGSKTKPSKKPAKCRRQRELGFEFAACFLLVPCFVYYSVLTMKTKSFSKASRFYRCENLIFAIYVPTLTLSLIYFYDVLFSFLKMCLILNFSHICIMERESKNKAIKKQARSSWQAELRFEFAACFPVVSGFHYSSTLKMGAIYSLDGSAFLRPTRRYNPETILFLVTAVRTSNFLLLVLLVLPIPIFNLSALAKYLQRGEITFIIIHIKLRGIIILVIIFAKLWFIGGVEANLHVHYQSRHCMELGGQLHVPDSFIPWNSLQSRFC
jgi:hypothetical protein